MAAITLGLAGGYMVLDMSHTLPTPKTLQEAIAFFSDPQKTFDYAIKLRWPDGKVTCPL
jgi:hypothetical protein